MMDPYLYDAISFDVYGTILDWEPELARFLTDWSSSGEHTINRSELLASYDRLRQQIQEQRPALRYSEVLKQTLSGLGEQFDIAALGIPMHRVLHVAQSKRADITVANQIGLTCVWVNRSGHIFGRTGHGADNAKPDYEVESLVELVLALK